MDVGNSNMVLGIFDNSQLLHHWRLQTDRHATEDEYAMGMKQLLNHVEIKMEQIMGVIISSVVPPLTTVLVRLTEKYFARKPIVLGPGIKTGLNLKTDNPREVGSDRIANAVAGVHHYGAPLIIVDFGTAATFCCIDESGSYIGGAITPGIHISSEALTQQAAKLTRVELVKPNSVIGKNTIESMQSGIYYGFVGLVEGIINRMKSEFRINPKVIATGGIAKLIGEGTNSFDVIDPWLTLEGLRIIYQRNVK